ncbi:hypothetical protein [Desulfobulbus alkaliphilus]|uniref:hypothetical protein n=1 Tax=Desulfobulbus alkaliphilus TaxID=869814 RepID=UPI0019631508|nr:hypothetical protein [Desulfobulbus alkaliphilus]MBM9537628.1 hypothetical protein [Desulfobulbus alkaliphilus]
MRPKRIAQSIFVLAVMCFASPLPAEDNVLGAIEEAVRQYQAGDYTGASSNLDYASQLVRQRKSERMKDLLPDAPTGWLAGEASSQAIGTAVLGGGLTVSRDYTRENSVLTVEIVSDSPVLQSVLMMTNNPLFAGAGGGKLETLKGQRAVVNYDTSRKRGEVYVVVASRFIVTIKGRHVTRDDLLTFAQIVDYESLEQN